MRRTPRVDRPRRLEDVVVDHLFLNTHHALPAVIIVGYCRYMPKAVCSGYLENATFLRTMSLHEKRTVEEAERAPGMTTVGGVRLLRPPPPRAPQPRTLLRMA